jgi:F420-non-reducing hydrogenase small subunit
MPDKYIDITFFNGSIRNSEQEHVAGLLRQKSKTIVAFGSCAHEGCIPGLANLHNSKEILEHMYLKEKSVVNPEGIIPKTKTEVKEGALEIPEFYDTVKTLTQTVDVDYYILAVHHPSNS